MITGLALALAVALHQDVDQPRLQFLPGTSEEFQSTAREIQSAAAAGDFDLAGHLAMGLPKREIVVQWDDTEVPDSLKVSYRNSLDAAIAALADTSLNLKFEVSSARPDIRFVFVPDMMAEPGQAPPALASFHSLDPTEPPVEIVLAVGRGVELAPSSAIDIQNEVLYGLGVYLGLARQPRPGTAMGRTDGVSPLRNRFSPGEIRLAQHNLTISELLRKSIADRTAPELQDPLMTVQPIAIDIERPVQGTVVFLDMQVNNLGEADLNYSIVPDCGCFAFEYPTTIGPGRSELVRIAIDTLEFPGPFEKAFYIYSNDPERPVHRIPVTGFVRPVFEFSGIDGSVLHLDSLEGDLEVTLTLQPEFKATILDISLAGVVGSASYEQVSEGSENEPRVYKIRVKPSLTGNQRRVSSTINVATDDSRFRVLRYGFVAQDGIAAQPSMIYFGEVGAGEFEAWAIIDQPGRPFNVTGVRSTTEYFEARYEKVSDTRYRIYVKFKESAPAGSSVGSVVVSTDKANQPTIEIPVQAFRR